MEFTLETEFNASPCEIYEAWLDSQKHGEMTGAEAVIKANAGGKFTAWDGYISGITLSMDPCRQIIQSWRTSEFGDMDLDSRLEINLKETDSGTLLSLKHSELPSDGEKYRTGWEEHYFRPMKAYFI